MSAIEKVKGIQRLLGVSDDGIAGPKTEAAWVALKAASVQERSGLIPDAVDARSEGNIKTLLPEVQPLARKLIHAAAGRGIIMVATSGTRTYAEQDDLYEQGRSKPGPIVTNARAGYSWHNHGVAFDLTEFKNGVPVWDSPNYSIVGAMGESLGLEWGGSWTSFKDFPHYQLTNGKTLAEARSLHDSGRTVFA